MEYDAFAFYRGKTYSLYIPKHDIYFGVNFTALFGTNADAHWFSPTKAMGWFGLDLSI